MKGGKGGRWTRNKMHHSGICEISGLAGTVTIFGKKFVFMNFKIYFHIYCCLGNIIFQLLTVAPCVQSEQFQLSWVNKENRISLKLCLSKCKHYSQSDIVLLQSFSKGSVFTESVCVQIQCSQADILQRGAAVRVWHGGAILVLHHHRSSASINIHKFSVKTCSAF